MEAVLRLGHPCGRLALSRRLWAGGIVRQIRGLLPVAGRGSGRLLWGPTVIVRAAAPGRKAASGVGLEFAVYQNLVGLALHQRRIG